MFCLNFKEILEAAEKFKLDEIVKLWEKFYQSDGSNDSLQKYGN